MPSSKNKAKEEINNSTTNYSTNSIINILYKNNSEKKLLIKKSFSLILGKDINIKCISTIYKNFFEKNLGHYISAEKLSYIKQIYYLFYDLNISIFDYKLVSSCRKSEKESDKKNIIDSNIKNVEHKNKNKTKSKKQNKKNNKINKKYSVKKETYVNSINDSLNIFNINPPKIISLYEGKFLLANRIDFSNVNNNYAIIKGNFPHCILNHIMFNEKTNVKKRFIVQMIAGRNKGKSIKIIYYKPLNQFNGL